MKNTSINKQWLEEHYCNKKLTITEIAPLIHKSPAQIYRYTKRFNLTRPKEFIGRNNITKTIATLHKKKSFNIGTKTYTPTSFKYREKEWLTKQYLINKLSMEEISKLCNVTHGAILKWLIHHKIARRPLGTSGKKNGNYKRGYTIIEGGHGYHLRKVPGHPATSANGYVREHRLVIEKHLKRYLTREETVHHKDGDKGNNELSNLQLFNTNIEHKKFEQQLCLFAKKILCSPKPEFLTSYRKDLQERFEDFLSKSE